MNFNNYTILPSSLGAGGQGSVFKGINNKTGEKVAIKMVDLSNLNNRRAFETEYQVFCTKATKLQNIVNIKGLFQKDNFGFVVMKQYECDLFTIAFEESDESLPEQVVKFLFKKICTAVKNLHHEGIAHLDIKPENILLDRNTMEPYICDFGNSFTSLSKEKRISYSKLIPALGYRGTKEYSAPEMELSPFSYNPFSADIFSLGITLYVLLIGSYPNRNKDGSINLNEFPEHFSNDCLDLLKSLLNEDPCKRCSINNILSHPYISKKSRILSKLKSSFFH